MGGFGSTLRYIEDVHDRINPMQAQLHRTEEEYAGKQACQKEHLPSKATMRTCSSKRMDVYQERPRIRKSGVSRCTAFWLCQSRKRQEFWEI